MRLNNFSKILLAAVAAAVVVSAQDTSMAPTMRVTPPAAVKAKKGTDADVTVTAILPPGYHANSNTPTDAYLIPLTLKWSAGPLEPGAITYPKPSMEKYSFSDKPLSVVTGQIPITTKFKVPATASAGMAAQNGTLRYQACNDRMCFPPKTVPVSISLTIE